MNWRVQDLRLDNVAATLPSAKVQQSTEAGPKLESLQRDWALAAMFKRAVSRLGENLNHRQPA